MPDLLAHALLAYAICLLLSWRYAWLTAPYRTIGMAGAFIPDMSKLNLIVPSAVIEHALGVPFDWFALHTTGGAAVSIGIGVLLVPAAERRRVGGLLAIGVASHLLADALLRSPTGRSYPLLWPLTYYHPPTPGLYVSTEPWPTLAMAVLAGSLWLATRYRRATSS